MARADWRSEAGSWRRIAMALRWLGVTAAAKANLRERGEHEQEKAEAKLFPLLARVERGRNEDLFVGCSRRQRR